MSFPNKIFINNYSKAQRDLTIQLIRYHIKYWHGNLVYEALAILYQSLSIL